MLRKFLSKYKTLLIITVGAFVLFIYFYNNKLVGTKGSLENSPQFAGEQKMLVKTSQIWGEPAKEMFPDIENPQYVNEDEAGTFLKDSDIVYFLKGENSTYVFPQLIIRHHEVVNDTIDKKPLAITFCILSNTPLIFNRIVDNQELTFRSLGPLMYGNQIMFDKQTDSYWNELTGMSFKGKFEGKRLQIYQPLEKTTWEKVKLFPTLRVLPPVLGIDYYHKNEQKNNPEARLGIGLMSMKEQKPDPRLSAGVNGFGITVHNSAKFYPEEIIKREQFINDTIGGWGILVLNNDNLGDQKIYRRYVNGKVLNFVVENGLLVDKETKSGWNLTGTAVSGPLIGTKLESPAYVTSYWYSWAAFYPNSTIYTDSSSE